MLTRLLCGLLRHPLLPITVRDNDPDGNQAVIVGERCRCAHRVEVMKVYTGQFPRALR